MTIVVYRRGLLNHLAAHSELLTQKQTQKKHFTGVCHCSDFLLILSDASFLQSSSRSHLARKAPIQAIEGRREAL